MFEEWLKFDQKLAPTTGRMRFVVDGDLVRGFADATLDDNPIYARTATAPPLFAVVAAFPATVGLLTTVVAPADLAVSLHLRQDMRFRRPLRVGEQGYSVARLHGVRGTSFGTTVCFQVTIRDAHDAEIVDVYGTILLRTRVEHLDVGAEAPDVTPPEPKGTRKLGAETISVPEDLTHRFGEATGDRLAVHVSDDAARRAGFHGVILHGMCTLSMCADAVGKLAFDRDMSRLKRLVATFAKPLYPGHPLTVSVTEEIVASDPLRFGFVANQGGRSGTRGAFVEVSS